VLEYAVAGGGGRQMVSVVPGMNFCPCLEGRKRVCLADIGAAAWVWDSLSEEAKVGDRGTDGTDGAGAAVESAVDDDDDDDSILIWPCCLGLTSSARSGNWLQMGGYLIP
jgi:hypothetical protein